MVTTEEGTSRMDSDEELRNRGPMCAAGVTEGEAQEEQFEDEFANKGDGTEEARTGERSETETALGESVPLEVTTDAEMVVVGTAAVPLLGEVVAFAVPLFGEAVAPTLLDAAA